MIVSFSYHYFSETPDFPVHAYYGYHDTPLYSHVHDDFSELVIVLDGKASHQVAGEQFPIRKGDVFVVGENTPHGFVSAERLTICNVMYREPIFAASPSLRQMAGFQALFAVPHSDARLRLSGTQFDEMQALLTGFLHEYGQKRPGWEDVVRGEFIRLCVMLSRQYDLMHTPESSVSKLADAVAHLEGHFTEHISLAQLAAISGYSERQFLRLFHAAFGVSPNSYLARLRLAEAKQLLQSTSLSVGEIAWRCGFDDQNYFTRFFKKHTGTTPTAYQRLFHSSAG